MAWIEIIEPAEATGELKAEYGKAIRRAGKVFNIVKVQSLNAPTLRASMDLYVATMYGPSGLSRAEREMLATVVSGPTTASIESKRTGRISVRKPRMPNSPSTLSTTRFAHLPPRCKALCKFAELLTLRPPLSGRRTSRYYAVTVSRIAISSTWSRWSPISTTSIASRTL